MRFCKSCCINTFLFLILSLISDGLAAQNGEVIPPSPNMATLQRFYDYPVDHSTGLLDVSIPLYDIKLKDYSFPVTIKFHASGRRWNSNFSPLGVGWSLNATGYLSREIRERPDELYQGLEMSADSIYQRENEGIERSYDVLIDADMSVSNGHSPNVSSEGDKLDAQHDIYTYSANGLSGRFVFDKFEDPFSLIYNNHKINGIPGASQCEITDETGTIYTFGSNTSFPCHERVDYPISGFTSYVAQSRITGWFLTKITRPSGENITFKYEQIYTGSPLYLNNNFIRGRIINTLQMSYGITGGIWGVPEYAPEINYFRDYIRGLHYHYHNYTKHYMMTFLKEIQFGNGKVRFDYDPISKRLTEVKIFDLSDTETPIRSASFSFIQTPGTNFQIPNNNDQSLDRLIIKDRAGSEEEEYTFDYYNDVLPKPDNSGVPSTDWWGYCNPTGNKPPISDPELEHSGCITCKSPDFSSKRSGMLKKIHYPTGGSREFFYEANKFEGIEGPGLRIGKVISSDGSNNLTTKEYKYGSNENGNGFIVQAPFPRDFKTEKHYLVYDKGDAGHEVHYLGTYVNKIYSTSPTPQMQDIYNLPIYYSEVAEYEYNLNQSTQATIKNGKTVYSYLIPAFEENESGPKKKEWTGGKLLSKSVYKSISSSPYFKEVENTFYSYNEYHYRKIPQVLVCRDNFIRKDDENDGNGNRLNELERVMFEGNDVLSCYDSPVVSGVMRLDAKHHSVYTDQGSLCYTTNYYYDNPEYLIPSRIVNNSSTGDSISKESRNVFDLYGPGFGGMLQKNWLFPIETSTYRMNSDGSNKRLLSSVFTKWDEQNGQPLNIYSIEQDSPLTNFTPAYAESNAVIKDSRYVEKYSCRYGTLGTLLEKYRPYNPYVSYIWGYNHQYPIAKIENATYAQIEDALGIADPDFGGGGLTPEQDDQLRGISGSFVTTYTYDPLIGMTSETDPNGRTTYYQYDDFGRLEFIRDQDNNIIKKYEYKYASETTN